MTTPPPGILRLPINLAELLARDDEGWPPRRRTFDDDLWLLIKYDRAALDVSRGIGGDDRACEYGALRGEILRRLKVTP
jgi:hypothetical protein